MLSGGLRTKGNRKQSRENMPLITVVTVVRNGEKILEKTILSVINQTYADFEYIIIDGASTDGTLDIIKKYEDRIDYWMSEPDKGIYNAMNKGIEQAAGEWINFMNAGDTFFSKEVLIYIFNSEKKLDKDISVVYGDTVYLNYDKGLLYTHTKNLNTFWKGMCFGHQACFVKTKLMKQYGFDENFKLAADYKLLFTLYNEGYKFLYVAISVVLFSIEGISDNNPKSVMERYKIISHKFPGFYHKLFYIFLFLSSWTRNILTKILGKNNYALIRKIKWNISIIQK